MTYLLNLNDGSVSYETYNSDYHLADIDRSYRNIPPGVEYIHFGKTDDRLEGTSGQEAWHLGGGDDYAHTAEGNDWIFGENGDDTISGGDGQDTIFGGNGYNELFGNDGFDTFEIWRGNYNDVWTGGQQDKVFIEMKSNLTIHDFEPGDQVIIEDDPSVIEQFTVETYSPWFSPAGTLLKIRGWPSEYASICLEGIKPSQVHYMSYGGVYSFFID